MFRRDILIRFVRKPPPILICAAFFAHEPLRKWDEFKRSAPDKSHCRLHAIDPRSIGCRTGYRCWDCLGLFLM